nr:Gag-Pol polyprotein [Tanacetum cinerariifolium]
QGFVNQPDGFIDPDHSENVYRLRKAQYGLKQALRAWCDELSTFLMSKDFTKGLWYPKDCGFKLTAFSYVDHVGCLDTRKSTSGEIQFLGEKLVSWMSIKKECTAMSTAEAETKNQLADMFTKALSQDTFEYLDRRLEKLEEDLVTYLKYFQDTSESSDDSTNVVNAPREPVVVKQDHGVNPPHINECCCECGNSLDGIFCQQCISLRFSTPPLACAFFIPGATVKNVEDKILVPKLPKNYARCGHPVDGSYCQVCSLIRKKLEEDLVTYFQDFQNTSESSDDSTNIFNAHREPFMESLVNDALVSLVGKCQPMNQNFYNSNSLGFDQTQPSQFPVIHPPPQETNIKILHDQENVINSVQTFLRKFNRYSSFETPKVLLLAWCRVFEIKDAFRNEQYKPEDIQELFCKLFNDVQNIHEELTEYINTPGWNRPASYNNGDDDDVDYTIAITPVLSTEEPDNSLSMGDEHLDTILATESDEVIKYSVEDIVPSPSESEGIPDTMCDVHLVNNPTPLEAKDHFEIVINSNDDYSSSNEDSFYNENIEYVEASPHDSEVVSLEVAEIVIPKDEEIEDDNLHEKLLN